ncbi:(2Fe-2S)-binding protein [Anaeromicropila herbilytica]|uniref:Bacterioferritin-associated ferredoxin n=1 Tax=Anaeromicropila herbilytica TaxID=2785025 RepID=A0A7R7IB13_9FIRM|nr:(2Fe-2S)-binding protein [Anaeromicropila herbilytica]BCN29047.1 hypothetical protein bsdtb5_03420 [Anaeromicropila herbilytica]
MFNTLISKFFKSKNKNYNQNSSQVVCRCMKVTEQDLISAVKNGANSFEEVQAVTKVSTGCGRCTDSVKILVDNIILKNKIDQNQVVCGCLNVTVNDMVNAIKNGAKSFEEVQSITKVGTGCGQCVEANRPLVAQLLKN